MASIDLEKTKDGRQTLICVRNAPDFPERPHIRIGRIGTNETLGEKGWDNQPFLIQTTAVREGRDLLIVLNAAVTNYINAGTPVEIFVQELRLSVQMPWPSKIKGALIQPQPDPPTSFIRRTVEPVSPPGDGVQEAPNELPTVPPPTVQQASPSSPPVRGTDPNAVEELLRKELESYKSELQTLREKSEGTDTQTRPADEDGAVKPARKGRAGLAIAALLLGLIIGAGGMWGFDRFVSLGNAETSAQYERDIARLRLAAFAPLATDLVEAGDRSPKGAVPNDIARQGLPADKADVVHDRARTFLVHGIENARRKDTAEAVYWYKKAVQLCAADAMLYLGDAYLNGDGATRDPKTGFQLIRMSNALGSPRAAGLVKQMLQREQIPLAPPTIADLYPSAR